MCASTYGNAWILQQKGKQSIFLLLFRRMSVDKECTAISTMQRIGSLLTVLALQQINAQRRVYRLPPTRWGK